MIVYQLRSPSDKILAQRRNKPVKLLQVAQRWDKPDNYQICKVLHKNGTYTVLQNTSLEHFSLNR